MGYVISTHGIGRLLNVAIPDSGYTGLRAAVIATGGTIADATIEDAATNSAIIGVNGETEVTNTNYARQPVTVTISRNTTANRVELRATVPTIANVAAGSVWKRVLYYFEVGTPGAGGDAIHIPLAVDTPTSTITPNGGPVTMPPLTIDLNDTSV